MFEIDTKYIVKNDIDFIDREFNTIKEAENWIKSCKEQDINDKFNSLVISKLDIPFLDWFGDNDIYLINYKNDSDFEIIKNWAELKGFDTTFLEYPEIDGKQILIIDNYIISFMKSNRMNEIIARFAKVIAILTEHNKNN